MTRRQKFLAVWFLAVIGAGWSAHTSTWGLAVSCIVVGISIGVPLMRAFTEHSK